MDPIHLSIEYIVNNLEGGMDPSQFALFKDLATKGYSIDRTSLGPRHFSDFKLTIPHRDSLAFIGDDPTPVYSAWSTRGYREYLNYQASILWVLHASGRVHTDGITEVSDYCLKDLVERFLGKNKSKRVIEQNQFLPRPALDYILPTTGGALDIFDEDEFFMVLKGSLYKGSIDAAEFNTALARLVFFLSPGTYTRYWGECGTDLEEEIIHGRAYSESRTDRFKNHMLAMSILKELVEMDCFDMTGYAASNYIMAFILFYIPGGFVTIHMVHRKLFKAPICLLEMAYRKSDAFAKWAIKSIVAYIDTPSLQLSRDCFTASFASV